MVYPWDTRDAAQRGTYAARISGGKLEGYDAPEYFEVKQILDRDYFASGKANTKMELVACGMRASGMVSVTMLLDQDPPPVPTGTATYCLPLTA